MSTIDDFIKDAQQRMDKSVDAAKQAFGSVRTGRASAALLDRISIDYYGTPTPLKQLATINVPEPRLLTIQPFDPSSLKTIEKAIQESDLGLNPSNDGKMVRVPIPALTEERRKQLAKQVHEFAEEHRTAIRKVRRDANDKLRKMLKDDEISEDAERDALEEVQKMTNTYVGRIDELARTKEQELLNV